MAKRRLPHFEVIRCPEFDQSGGRIGGEIGHHWYFRVVAPNGKTLAHSENYRRRAAAERACRAINPHLQIKVFR